MKRNGILCAGNFIVDRLRVVESWPEQDMLTSIISETFSNGGGPFNVLKDFSALESPFPLEAAGCVGNDPDGEWIIKDCRDAAIDTRQLHRVSGVPTSYTEVICVAPTGRRTFFHRRGANALFDSRYVDFALTHAGHFHLAYLMLLDALDADAADGRTHASKLLEQARDAGLTTSADLVSTESAHFMEKVKSALPFIDYLFINELEAERVTGMRIKNDQGISLPAARAAAQALVAGGVKRQVILHFISGAIVCDVSGEVTMRRALRIPQDKIVGANGAGDAFAAGYLFGIQSLWNTSECLRMAVSAAAACLTHASPSAGLRSAKECLELGDRYSLEEALTKA
jgi:sugar/nucleoside kinase (ribokinase family)